MVPTGMLVFQMNKIISTTMTCHDLSWIPMKNVVILHVLTCCPNRGGSSLTRTRDLLLTPSKDDTASHGSIDLDPSTQQSKGSNRWETLELYLEKYKGFNAKLSEIVVETLLRTDPQIELPFWWVHMFKGNQKESYWGMTVPSGFEPNKSD
uniref:Uncharacterized protein n=1 Tax=Vitis vinifera TaxID=29760 RepID=F6HT20_VITVI